MIDDQYCQLIIKKHTLESELANLENDRELARQMPHAYDPSSGRLAHENVWLRLKAKEDKLLLELEKIKAEIEALEQSPRSITEAEEARQSLKPTRLPASSIRDVTREGDKMSQENLPRQQNL